MKFNVKHIAVIFSGLALGACVSLPNGPSRMALPGSGKSFDQFQYDDASCRGFAQTQIGGKTAQQASNDSFVETAVLGTAIGAALGAATGGGHGAGVGAAGGLLMGSAIGANAANVSGHTTQQVYDNGYIQCMYAKGHKVPVSGRLNQQSPYSPAPASPQSNYVPPPPPPPSGSPAVPPGY
jgi:hypothetical protein